jgi:hypothetical protein
VLDPEALFAQADADGDGMLSQAEFAAAMAPRHAERPEGRPSGRMAPPRWDGEYDQVPEASAESGDGLALQQHLLEQIASLVADESLTDADRELLRGMAEAVYQLDPSDPEFALRLEEILSAAGDP